jgi:hypothetical protein
VGFHAVFFSGPFYKITISLVWGNRNFLLSQLKDVPHEAYVTSKEVVGKFLALLEKTKSLKPEGLKKDTEI